MRGYTLTRSHPYFCFCDVAIAMLPLFLWMSLQTPFLVPFCPPLPKWEPFPKLTPRASPHSLSPLSSLLPDSVA